MASYFIGNGCRRSRRFFPRYLKPIDGVIEINNSESDDVNDEVQVKVIEIDSDSEDLQIYPGSQFLEGEDTTKWPQVPPLGLVVQHKNGWHYRIKQEPPSILPAHLVINETRLNWLIRNVKIHYGDANYELLCLGIVKRNIRDKAFPGGEWIVDFDDNNPPIYLVHGLKFEMLKDEDLINAGCL
ncbi:hypothetical protein FRX31_016402 [Thalictrum thalictroides]|uniref:Uncharacterized protein n=1 Tax=Thalictrum thalictroides TaxID=46969 RepID=A0A7J6WCS7_THATH|nr:hypothetical protein FRX31_016402 [Thalictrum thalictroides]